MDFPAVELITGGISSNNSSKKKNLQTVSKIDYVEIRYFTRNIVSIMVLEAISWVLWVFRCSFTRQLF